MDKLYNAKAVKRLTNDKYCCVKKSDMEKKTSNENIIVITVFTHLFVSLLSSISSYNIIIAKL